MSPRLHVYDPRAARVVLDAPPALAALLSPTATAEELAAVFAILGPNIEMSVVSRPDLMAFRDAVAWFEGDTIGVAILLPEDADEPTIREWRLRVLRYAPYVLGLATPETDAAVSPEVYASDALHDVIAEAVSDASYPIIAPAWDDAEVGRAIRAAGGRQ